MGGYKWWDPSDRRRRARGARAHGLAAVRHDRHARTTCALVARVDPAGSRRRPGPPAAPLFATLDDALAVARARRGRRVHRAGARVRQRVAAALARRSADGRRHDRPRRRRWSSAWRRWRPNGARRLLIVPNFALGAVLAHAVRGAGGPVLPRGRDRRASRADKVDAPSGTSLRTARLMTERPGWPPARRPRRPVLAGS